MSDWEDDDNASNAVQTHYEQDLNRSGGQRSPRSAPYNNRRDDRYDDEKRRERGRDGGRDNGRGGGGGGRSYEHKDTVDVRSDCIGMIIGKAGSNIQRIQTDFDVRVNLDRDSGTVTVQGNQESDVQSAIDHIKGQMEKSDNRSGGGGRGGRSGGYSGGGGGGGYSGGGGGGNYNSGSDRGSSYNSRFGTDQPREKNDFYSGGGGGGGGGYQKRDNDFYSAGASSANDDNQEPGGLIDWNSLNEKAEVARKIRWASCPPLTKNFYKEAPEVAGMSSEEVQRIRLQNNNTTVSRVFKPEDGADDNIPNPVWKFEQCFSAYPDLLAEITKQDFPKPSPIQAQAWPILLKGEDMIGIAQTGTGKTLAFLLPAMIHTEYQSIPRSERGGPNVLVMAPTRELALQIEKEVNKYQFRGMKA